MDNKLMMDISCQLWHLLATMSADADKCYDRINHNIMSLLLLAIVGSMGPVVAMFHPIQTMKIFNAQLGEILQHSWGEGDETTLCRGFVKEMGLLRLVGSLSDLY